MSQALERKRAHYNALFAEARQRNAELEGADVLEHIKLRVAPIFQALPELSPEAQDRTLDALYRASLELLVRRLAGKRARGSINALWESLLPRVAHLVALAPRRVVAALSNAAFNLDQAPSARTAEWLQRMLAVSAHCSDIETLIAIGQVAAWRAGLPQFRAGALALCPSLPTQALQLVLDAGTSLEQLTSKRFVYSNADTWGLSAVARLGGFSGFGGQFTTPPMLTQIDGSLIAFDHESAWEIHADSFGALLRRRQALPRKGKSPQPEQLTITADGHVRWGNLSSLFPELAGAVSFIADSELLAVVPPRSHYVYLIAITQGQRC